MKRTNLHRIIIPMLGIGTSLLAVTSVSATFPTSVSPMFLSQLPDSQKQGAVLFQEGFSLFRKGQLKDSSDKFKEALSKFQEAGNKPGEGLCLLFIGSIKERLSDYLAAKEYYEASLEIWQQFKKPSSWQAITLGNLAGVYDSLGETEKVLDFYNQAFNIFKKLKDKQGVGETLNNIGTVWTKRGEYKEAKDNFEKALNIVNGIQNKKIKEKAIQANIFNNLGEVYRRQSQYPEAKEKYNEALPILQDIKDRPGEAITLNNLGLVDSALGNYNEAEDNYNKALEIFKAIPNKEGVGTVFNNLGGIYYNRSQYTKALEFHYKALEILKEIGLQSGIASTLDNIGGNYRSLGEYEEALKFYEEAQEIFKNIKDRPGEGTILNNIGIAYQNIYQNEEAEKKYQEALKIRQEINDKDGEAVTSHNLGSIYERLNQEKDAKKYYQQALMIREEIGDRLGQAATYNNLGGLYRRLGDNNNALNSYEKALDIVKDIGNKNGEGIILSNFGSFYEKQGNKYKAIEKYKESIDIKESIQNQIKIEEFEASFASQQIDVYEQLINLLWQEGLYEKAFNYVGRAKARAFLNQLAKEPINFRAGVVDSLLDKERQLKNQIIAQRKILAEGLANEHNKLDEEEIEKIKQEINKFEQQYTKLLTQIKLQNPEVASLISLDAKDLLSLSKIQQELDNATTLVEYFVIEDRTLAFVITRNSFKAVALNINFQNLSNTITKFRKFASLNDPHPDTLQQLHQWLIVPLKPHLTNSKLIIVPHSKLHYIPFSAFTDGQKYLIDSYTLSTLPSANVLRYLSKKKEGKSQIKSVLALGNPSPLAPLSKLRYAAEEVKNIAKIYNTKPLIGKYATESILRAKSKEAGIIHIAAHGEYNDKNPLFSALHLTPAKNGSDDGRLEVNEIYELDLTKATNLVVLSACKTQVGEQNRGDEVVALNRAFIYAGTPSVIASLWDVDDKTTALLMKRFYENLKAGNSKAESLRQAQIEIRKEYPHPNSWAAFSLTGDGGR